MSEVSKNQSKSATPYEKIAEAFPHLPEKQKRKMARQARCKDIPTTPIATLRNGKHYASVKPVNAEGKSAGWTINISVDALESVAQQVSALLEAKKKGELFLDTVETTKEDEKEEGDSSK